MTEAPKHSFAENRKIGANKAITLAPINAKNMWIGRIIYFPKAPGGKRTPSP